MVAIASEIITAIDKGHYDQAKSMIDELDVPSHLLHYYYAKYYREKGQLEEGIHEAKIAFSQFNYDSIKGQRGSELQLYFRLCGELSYLFYLRGYLLESETSLDDAEKKMSKLSEDNQQYLFHEMLFLLFIRGNLEGAKGNGEKGLKLLKKVKDLLENSDMSETDERDLGFVLNDMGYIHYMKGEFLTAIEYFSKSLVLKEKFGNPNDIAYTLNNIGTIYFDQGNISKAEEMLNRSLKVFGKSGNYLDAAYAHNMLGLINFSKHDAKQAIHHLQKSLSLREKSENEVFIATSLLTLLVVYQSQEDEIHIEKTLERLEEMSIRSTSKLPSLYYKYALGLVQKSKPMMKAKVEAMEIFQQIINMDTANFEVKFNSMLYLCDLYLEEFTIFHFSDTYMKARVLVKEIVDYAQSTHSYPRIIESLILESKFVALDGDYDLAVNILDHAKIIAKENNLKFHQARVDTELKLIEDKLEEWRVLLERNASLIDRLLTMDLKDYLHSTRTMF
ncbi:MAG: tetratricopeptide repeat protein [Candidatus Heimdallarchaeota archaeon]|nr:tetratricopeptide repeat protein [Candidatus Heimdallarchaeota archaeon]